MMMVLTSVSGDSAQDLQQQEDLKQPITLSEEDAKNSFSTSMEIISHLLKNQKLNKWYM